MMLEHLFEHNAWANARLLEFCEPLTAEQLATSAVGTYGRLDDTLVHILAAVLTQCLQHRNDHRAHCCVIVAPPPYPPPRGRGRKCL